MRHAWQRTISLVNEIQVCDCLQPKVCQLSRGLMASFLLISILDGTPHNVGAYVQDSSCSRAMEGFGGQSFESVLGRPVPA